MRKYCFIITAFCSTLWSQHYQVDFPPDEFQERWRGVFDQIGEDAVAVVQGIPLTNGFIMPRAKGEF